MSLYKPGTTETDQKKQNRAIQGIGTAVESLTTKIGGLPSTFVTSFKSRVGAITPAQGDYPSDLIPGTATNSAAAAGNIGEENHATGTTGNYTSGSPQLICSILVPAGDFDVYGYNDYSGSGLTSTSDWSTLITTLSTPTVSNQGSFPVGVCHERRPSGSDYCLRQSIGPVRFSLSVATTLYMHGQVTITSGTVYTSSGYLRWRRMR